MSRPNADEDLSFDGPVTARPALPPNISNPEGLDEETLVIIAEDHVPTIDDADSEKPPTASYQDWDPASTRVISYTNSLEQYPKDRYAPSLAAARAECEKVHGRIYEVNAVPGRWFFRVARQQVKVIA